MKSLKIYDYDENRIYQLIKEKLANCVVKNSMIIDTRLHHNAQYSSISSVIEYGLLSKRERARLIENRGLTAEEEYRGNDPFCVCGNDCVSIANTDYELDAYPNEDIYGIRDDCVNIILDGNFDYARVTTNYADECLVNKIITPEHFTAFDIRLLKYMYLRPFYLKLEEKEMAYLEKLHRVVFDYNFIVDISKILLEKKLNIPIREMSEDSPKVLSLEKVSTLPHIKL